MVEVSEGGVGRKLLVEVVRTVDLFMDPIMQIFVEFFQALVFSWTADDAPSSGDISDLLTIRMRARHYINKTQIGIIKTRMK